MLWEESNDELRSIFGFVVVSEWVEYVGDIPERSAISNLCIRCCAKEKKYPKKLQNKRGGRKKKPLRIQDPAHPGFSSEE
ncbi:hypothetical protein M406DRAFT_356012 [Cryphonectria parasitica EP155]|uniref:Uncharacterized protein n=1 Tax=Cryphonectria parasitica (strain ATCC 38755 / EP155) TaxID=660469 RepID=A0A9P4Y3B0_CRYP1|nr:uncharacterized protein M406DRAFT_356012 [Cryphonectria parasitica EP155]KAF3765670.1 hypothetical protein M406DRAFT_356012 [Cryphonectria parasitica EP155]